MFAVPLANNNGRAAPLQTPRPLGRDLEAAQGQLGNGVRCVPPVHAWVARCNMWDDGVATCVRSDLAVARHALGRWHARSHQAIIGRQVVWRTPNGTQQRRGCSVVCALADVAKLAL